MEHGIPFYSVPFVPFSGLDPDRGAFVCYTCSIEVALMGLDSRCRTTAEVSHLEIGSLAGLCGERKAELETWRIRTKSRRHRKIFFLRLMRQCSGQ